MKVKLSDLYDIGSSKRVFQSEWCESGVPFYRAREIAKLSDDGFVDNELFIDEELYSQYTEKYGKPEAGDVMVTGVGTLGVCYVVKPEDRFYFKDGNILWFRQKAKDKILPEYLVKVFDSKGVKDFIAKNSSGTTVGTFTIQTAKKMEISLPSLDEQKKIIDKIIRTESIIKQRKKELQLLDTIIKARFVEMFGNPETNEKEWKMNTFGDICTVRQGLQIPISKRLTQYEDDCYEYITVQYLHGGKEREYIKSPKTSVICTQNDILMTRTGNTGMVVTGVDGVFHNNFFLIDFDRNKYDKDFLVQYLKLDIIQADILRRAGASTIPDLNHSDFYKIKIFEPPIELQKQFTELITQVDKSKLQKFSAA